MKNDAFMEQAIDVAVRGIEAGQSPFGCVIVENGKVVSATHNTVWKTCDPTAHAEVNAIRAAATELKRIDLSGCDLYTTCEPCPMCLTAIHWAKIDNAYFGATIEDAKVAGFSELEIPALSMVEQGGSPLKIEGGMLQEKCAQLFHRWLDASKGQAY